MKTILVLFGGCSTEYEVSLHSAYAVLSHMDPARYTPLAVGITREGQWLCYTGDLSRLEDGTWQQAADCIPCTPLVEREAHALLLLDGSGRRLLFDAVFPVLHGKNGEDGTVQGLFELAGVPVIGCGTLSSALCMDKDRAHQLAALAGIRVPRSHVFHSSDDFSRIAQAAEELGYPVFVKPVRAGSSFGITKVSGPEELPAAMEEAFRHDSAVILEETIPGFEVGCAVMGNEELTVGLVDEIALSEGFFNYEEKYTLKTSAIHCPARIPPEKAAEIQAAAKTIYRALDCRVFARVDLFLTPDGEIVFNEVNTIPGFTAHSRYPSMMQGIGISFGELVTRLIEAFRHDSAVILEETIPGFEVGCAVMGNEELTVGLVDEIALSEGFFNYEEKYTLKTSAIHCPARIPPEKAAEIQAAAKTIYRALDCRVFARVDLFLTPDGEIVFNEVNTIPGFTAHSRYPSMMQGIGISFGELVTRLIELGVAG